MSVLNIEMHQQSPASSGAVWRGRIPVGAPTGFVRATASVSAADGSGPGAVHGSLYISGEGFASLVDSYSVSHGDDLVTTWLAASAGDVVEFRTEVGGADLSRVWVQRLVVTHVTNVAVAAAPTFLEAPRLVNATTGDCDGGAAAGGDVLRIDLGATSGSIPQTMTFEFFYLTNPDVAIQSGPSSTYELSAYTDTARDIGGRVHATNTQGNTIAEAAEVYRTADAPAKILTLEGPAETVAGQPGDLGIVVATTEGTAPIVALWEHQAPGQGWVDLVSSELGFDLGLLDLLVGSNRLRLTVSNGGGSDSRTLSVHVAEPSGVDVISWASADFNLGDVGQGVDPRWLVSPTDVTVHNAPLVPISAVLRAPVGTSAQLQRSTDLVSWEPTFFAPPSAESPMSVSHVAGVSEGTTYWRWVANVGGTELASNVATVVLTLGEDTVPPVVTVGPVASGPGPVLVTGTATDNIGVSTVSVLFFRNGGPAAGVFAVIDGSTWTASWDPTIGGHIGSGFTANVYASDGSGNQAEPAVSNQFTISGAAGSDVTPPVSTIDAVASGAGVFSLSGTSTDVESGVAEVLIKMWAFNGSQIGPTVGVVATLSGDNWSADIDPGAHLGSGVVATVVATDAAGNEAVQVVSNSFSVTSTPPPLGSLVFDNGQPGEAGDAYARETWFWLYNRAYFVPNHSQLNASPQRVVYVSPSGGGSGLTPGSTVTLNGYTAMAQPGDQVRMMAGVHDTDGQFRTVQGTAAMPIRFIRDDPAVAPIVRNMSGSNGRPTWGFSDSMYLGFHGIEVDGQSGDNWGLAFGRVWDTDLGRVRCHNIDIWHCELHHGGQTVTKFGGTQGPTAKTLAAGPDNLSHDAHYYATEVHHSGGNNTHNLNELIYAGGGNTPEDHVDNLIVEACDLHHSRGGEALDLKFDQSGGMLVGSVVHDIQVSSQGAITAQNSFLTVKKVVVWNVGRPAAGGPHYDTNAVFAPNGLVEDMVCWNLGASAVGYPNKLAAGTMTLRRVAVWDAATNYGNVGMLLDHASSAPGQTQYHEDGSGTPTIVVEDCISEDGSYTSGGATSGAHTSGVSYTAHDSSIADFVGPVIGTAEAVSGRPGTGFALAAGSSIPASAGPQGLS